MTASAYLIRGDEILMIYHLALQKWLAPGGHREAGDGGLRNTAQRELQEETGVAKVRLAAWHTQYHMLPIDIDSHPIPDNSKKQEPAHMHHDFRYVFFLDQEQDINLQAEEVTDGAWQKLSQTQGDQSFAQLRTKIKNLILHSS